MRQHRMMHPPCRHDEATLVRRGGQGTYWQMRDGMVVQVAAHEERGRYVPPQAHQLEACAPEGGVVYAPAPDAAQRDTQKVGVAGLAMALWMRLFAGTA
ncbi:MAG: hypothetical protein ABI294_08200 [Casimicrobiaceae bacterium]